MTEGGCSANRDERLSARERLRQRGDYQACYRHGRRRNGALVSLYYRPNDLGYPRLGITVSRKVGGSVTRHRIKRRIKEIYRRWSERRSLPAFDLVVHVRPGAAGASFEDWRRELTAMLGRLVAREHSGSAPASR